MSTARPEADSEYSRGQGPSSGGSGPPPRPSDGRVGLIRNGILAGALLGAALLLIAEFTPLLHVHTSAPTRGIQSVSTGGHHSYALVPVALLAAVLAFAFWQTRNRQALIATGVLGIVTLFIALLGDLPDAQASGLVGSATTRFAAATATPAIGLYLETLGAVILLVSAAAGLLLIPAPNPRGGADRQRGRSRSRSAS
jgi:hypothetical protein